MMLSIDRVSMREGIVRRKSKLIIVGCMRLRP